MLRGTVQRVSAINVDNVARNAEWQHERHGERPKMAGNMHSQKRPRKAAIDNFNVLTATCSSYRCYRPEVDVRGLIMEDR
ncbi:hypothetical protein SAMN05446935_3492 [Burkholderia sp. YR290]|nr:hypothetical protein PMI06_007189 [Burkholderia sp. BT03]SKC91294.1 hypothetical protein SAMN06266956_4792 [Paraburkholderia hospita]SOE69415.1 hypothetical protein SAMN05446935_3492 [Burkholderia sp. YR290]